MQCRGKLHSWTIRYEQLSSHWRMIVSQVPTIGKKSNFCKVHIVFSMSEADLLMIEMEANLSNGATDSDYRNILDKVKTARLRAIVNFDRRHIC